MASKEALELWNYFQGKIHNLPRDLDLIFQELKNIEGEVSIIRSDKDEEAWAVSKVIHGEKKDEAIFLTCEEGELELVYSLEGHVIESLTLKVADKPWADLEEITSLG